METRTAAGDLPVHVFMDSTYAQTAMDRVTGDVPIFLSVTPAEAVPLAAKFPLTFDSSIHLYLFGEVITCDLKNPSPDPAVVIQLLKTTQSERANYMTVGASYRRAGLPKCGIAIIEAMIEGTFQLTGCFSL